MNTVTAIQTQCLSCAGSSERVKRCGFIECELYPYRLGGNTYRGNLKASNDQSPLEAIRRECLSCSGDMPEEVKRCLVKSCALYPYRMGKNPFVSEARRKASQKNALALSKWATDGKTKSNLIPLCDELG